MLTTIVLAVGGGTLQSLSASGQRVTYLEAKILSMESRLERIDSKIDRLIERKP